MRMGRLKSLPDACISKTASDRTTNHLKIHPRRNCSAGKPTLWLEQCGAREVGGLPTGTQRVPVEKALRQPHRQHVNVGRTKKRDIADKKRCLPYITYDELLTSKALMKDALSSSALDCRACSGFGT